MCSVFAKLEVESQAGNERKGHDSDQNIHIHGVYQHSKHSSKCIKKRQPDRQTNRDREMETEKKILMMLMCSSGSGRTVKRDKQQRRLYSVNIFSCALLVLVSSLLNVKTFVLFEISSWG